MPERRGTAERGAEIHLERGRWAGSALRMSIGWEEKTEEKREPAL